MAAVEVVVNNSAGNRHDAFSVKFQGFDAKLTGVEGAKVIEEILG